LLGVCSYLVPQIVWTVFVSHWRSSLPLVEGPLPVVAAVFQSGFYSLVLWSLTLSVYHSYGERSYGRRRL
jgi:hypothetical protein